MESRRRLVLLAVIIVAVAIGAVGLTLASLFEAGLEQQRQLLGARLSESLAVQDQQRRMATAVRDGTQWRTESGALSADVELALAEAIAGNPQPGKLIWQIDSGGQVLVALRVLDAGRVRIAWVPLAELREPYHRAALQASAGLLVLLALGLFLFYRMTSPLLRNIETSEARYRTLFSSTAEGVLLIGERIEECNDRVCEMLGCRREDVIGMPWRDFFRHYGGAGGRLPAFEGRVVEALDGRGGPFVWEFLRQDGASSLVVEIALRRLANGKHRQVLASLRDVSYREEATRALRMAERTLRESRDKIAQAGRSSALIELAAGIAHEVNQPLAAIANYAQASRRLVVPGQACPEDVPLALDRIAEQAQRAGDAIHRIRALVAVPGPGGNITCMNRLIGEVVSLMSEEIDAAGATVTVDLAEDMVPVVADPLQLQQVVVQLLRNALEAVACIPAAQRLIHISTRRCGDDEVEVRVIDQGGGIAVDDQHRLFEPFFSTREGGMGMGLAISLSIIRSHLGELEFDPEHEGGCCFRFRLPADTSQANTHQEGSAASCRDKVAP